MHHHRHHRRRPRRHPTTAARRGHLPRTDRHRQLHRHHQRGNRHGSGTFAVTIQETANCTQLAGQGQFVLQVPTTNGTLTVAGTFDVSGSSAGAVLTGDLTGTAHVTAVLEGDCFTTPLTRVTTQVDVHVGP
jgi:hypothetical protein